MFPLQISDDRFPRVSPAYDNHLFCPASSAKPKACHSQKQTESSKKHQRNKPGNDDDGTEIKIPFAYKDGESNNGKTNRDRVKKMNPFLYAGITTKLIIKAENPKNDGAESANRRVRNDVG